MKRRAFLVGLGTAAVWPRVARAQSSARTYRVVFAAPSTPLDRIETDDPTYAVFLGELRRLGYVAGENLVMERRSAEGRPERYADIAREVAGLKPDAVVVSSSKFAVAFKEAAGGVPVVALAFDPVGSGLASSIAHPGGNVTGFSGGTSVEIIAKQFEILKAIDTAITRIGFVTDASPDSTWAALQFTLRGLAGLRYGVSVLGQPVASPAREPEYRKLIEELVDQGASALIIDATAANLANASMIAALANASRLPSISADAEQARGGCLAACAPDLGDSFRQMAGYVDRILRGEKAGELAFIQPATFTLTINRKTAKALGLQLAPELVALASEVID